MALCVVTALGVWELLSYYPELPDQVASHFSAGGLPNGYSSKESFLTAFCTVLGSVFVVTGGLASCLRFIPSSMINIPHSGYWLAPERRPATIAVLSGVLLWGGAVTQLFVGATIVWTVRFNLGEDVAWPVAVLWTMLGGYIATMLVGVVWLFKRFARPSTE